MLFFEVFNTIKTDAGISSIFRDTEVDKVVSFRDSENMEVHISSYKIIDHADVRRMEFALQKQVFSRAGKTVTLHEAFILDGKDSIEDIWPVYRNVICDEFYDKSVILGNIIRASRISADKNRLHITMWDSIIHHVREKEITALLCSIWKERFGIDAEIIYSYEEIKDKKPEYNNKVNDDAEGFVTGDSEIGNANAGIVVSDTGDDTRRQKPVAVGEDNNASVQAKKGSAYDKAKYAYRKKLPEDPDIFYGRPFEGEVVKLSDIQGDVGEVVIQGKIIRYEGRETRTGKLMVTIAVTDYTDTIPVKLFLNDEQRENVPENLKIGKNIRLKGVAVFDTWVKDIIISSVQGIKSIPDFVQRRMDNAPKKRVELHAHTMMSDMDGVVSPADLIKTAFRWGHEGIAITDHGVVQAFPEASHAINWKDMPDGEEKERAKNFKIIYGMEAYLVDDEPDKVTDSKGHEFVKGSNGEYSDEALLKMPTYHTIILCRNDTGRVNLYKMISLSHIKYYNKRPRIPKSLLAKNREGLIVGSACEAGELFRAILHDKPEAEIRRIADFYDYYEVQQTGNNYFLIEDRKFPQIETEENLRSLNRRIVQLADEDGKPAVATCDVHFLNPEDEVYRRIIMAAKGFQDADRQAPLYLHTTEEMLEEFSYLGASKAYEVVVENTRKIFDMVEKISPVRPDKCPPVIENSDQTLREICYNRANSMYGDPLPATVKNRLEHELESIIKNGFAVMYIIAQKLVWKSNEDGYLVGSRGSVGSSFVATMAGITEVNPLPAHYYCAKCHYCDFDSDMVKAYAASSGCDMPDRKCPECGTELVKEGHNIPFETFLGFYGDKEPDIDLNFSGEYQSKAHDYTEVIFGEGHTFRAGTIGTLAEKTAYGYVLKYCEEHGIHKRNDEMERLANGCVGVRRTTGQHPGGIVVLPHGEEIYSFTPVQHPANDVNSTTITTHFDYHSIDHNLLKLDILGHDDPTMIRALEDYTGVDAKKIRLDDKQIVSLFSSTEALGIKPEDIGGCDLGSLGLPELGTDFVMQMLRDTRPQSFSDMIRISGLSHGTDVWLNNTQTLIADGKCTLSTAICTRDDIMTYLIGMGVETGLAFKIMESVRKGKGLKPDMEAAMLEKNVPEWYIWSCKKIKYMFPKAHACAYVMMAFRIAYFKINYPLAYYAAYFSIRATAFDYEKMCLGREKLEENMAVIRSKGDQASQKEGNQYNDMKIVQEMYARGFEFIPIDIYKAKAREFQIVDGKLMPAFSTLDGLGDKAADQIYETAQQGAFLSREDFKNRCKVSGTVVELMNRLKLLGDIPESDQISLMDLMGSWNM